MPAASVSAEEIQSAFSEVQVPLDQSVVQICIKLCQSLAITPTKLYDEWEAYSINKKIPVEQINAKTLSSLEFSLLKTKQFTHNQISKQTMNNPPLGVKRKQSQITDSTPEPKSTRTTKPTQNPAVEPAQKEQCKIREPKEETFISKKGEILITYNQDQSNKLDSLEEPTTIPTFKFPYSLPTQTNGFRYMNEPIPKKVSNMEKVFSKLRQRIERELVEENSIEANPDDDKVRLLCTDRLEPFHLFLQHPVICTARISKESETAEGNLLFLEGVHASQPVRSVLNTDRMGSFSIFPGQTVAVKGTNPTSKVFRAAAIRPPSVLPAFRCNPSTQGIRIMCASGPFSSANSVSHQQLDCLLEQVTALNPDVLLLNGPFVDERNSVVQAGNILYHGINFTAEQWFQEQINRIMAVVENKKTLVLLVPSLSDVHHPFFVYPQPGFQISHPLKGKQLFLMEDPCTVTFNNDQLTVGVTSADILVHLASEEVARRPKTDKITQLLHHLLEQGSYYPLYPPKESHNLDTTNIHKIQMKYNSPNILITPSDFNPFIKQIGSTVCINPGRVVKGKEGTFAHIVLHPTETHQILSQLRIDICNV